MSDEQETDDNAETTEKPGDALGKRFARWFNSRLARTPNPTIRLGTKSATVIALAEDGTLTVMSDGEGTAASAQLVAFEGTHLDALLKQFVAAT